jgi:competence protein ComEC
MPLSLLQLRALVVGLLFVAVVVLSVGSVTQEKLLAAVGQGQRDGYLTVAFLDVGQGDAIYIETPDGVQVLIDGGPDRGVLQELSAVMPLFDRTIDVVLATHSDKDHIGGLTDVLNRYAVKNIVRTENKNDTSVTEIFAALESVETDGLHIGMAGQQLLLGASTTLAILSPQGDPRAWESNTASLVTQLQYGEVAFMFTGDAPIGIEEYVAKSYGSLLKSEVLKLGHHGSKTSSGELFLKTVAPTYAVVSAGNNNRYGHPHTEVLQRVEKEGALVVSTAESGTIVFKSDGKQVWVEE